MQVDIAAGNYNVTRKVRELSSGFTEQSSLLAVGSSIAIRVTREIKWPLAIGVRSGDALMVGCSTMPYSPLAVHVTTIGTRLGLLNSAMGLAYMAHCSQQARGIVLELLANSQSFEAATIKARFYEAGMNGFAIRHAVRGRDSATLAVPVLHEGYAVAALGMTTFGRAMTRVTVEHFAPVLKQIAAQISEAYGAHGAFKLKWAKRVQMFADQEASRDCMLRVFQHGYGYGHQGATHTGKPLTEMATKRLFC